MYKQNTNALSKIRLTTLLAVIAVVFFYINREGFMIGDDYQYASTQVCTGGKVIALPSWLPIDSITVPTAAVADWPVPDWSSLLQGWLVSPWCDNIRLGNYTARLMLFLGGASRVIFNYINTLVFILTLVFMARFACKKVNTVTLGLSLAAFIIFCPGFEATCVWLDGSTNYLWGGLLLVFYLLHISHIRKIEKLSLRNNVLGCILALLIGIQNEALAAAMLLVLLVLFLWSAGQRGRWFSLIFFQGLTETFYLVSPGNLNRMAMANEFSLFDMTFLVAMIEHVMLPLMIIVFLAFISRRSLDKDFISEYLPLIIYTTASLALFVYTVHGTTWGTAGPVFYLCCGLILCIVVLLGKLAEQSQRILSLSGASIALGIMGAYACLFARDHAVEEEIYAALKNNEQVVCITNLSGSIIPPTWLLERAQAVLHSERWPKVKSIRGLEEYSGRPQVIIEQFPLRNFNSDALAQQAVTQPIMISLGNTACIKLPKGWRLKGVCRALGHCGDTQVTFYTPHAECTLFALRNRIASKLRNLPRCNYSEHYMDNAFFCSFQTDDKCSIDKLVIVISNGNNTESWELIQNSAQKL